METRMVKAPNITWRQIGDDTVIIKEDGQATHVLNMTAGFIWNQCDGKHDIDDIITGMCQHFDVLPDEATVDIKSTIDELADYGLLQEADVLSR